MARGFLSKTVHYLSWVAIILCALATADGVATVAHGNNAWAALAFMMTGTFLSAGILCLVVLPSTVLYLKNRQKTDLQSLWLGGCSILVLLAETILIWWVIPQGPE